MIRQAISPRLAMSNDAITGRPRARERERSSASRPPMAPRRPGAAAAGDGQRSWAAGAVARFVSDHRAGAADGNAHGATAAAAPVRQGAERFVADPAHGPAGAGAQHEVVTDHVDEGAAAGIEAHLATALVGRHLVAVAQRAEEWRG